jgi:hypothetical protein
MQTIPTPIEFIKDVCRVLTDAGISHEMNANGIFCSPEDLPKVIEITCQQLHNKQLQGTIFVNE